MVDILRHVEQLGEADVLTFLDGHALVEPDSPLYVDAQALWKLQRE